MKPIHIDSVTHCLQLLFAVIAVATFWTKATFGLPTPGLDVLENDVNYISNSHLLSLSYWEQRYPISKTANEISAPTESARTIYLSCVACKIGAKAIQYLLHMGMGKESIASLARSFCNRFHVSTERVCKGLSETFKDEVVFVFSKVSLNPADICGTIVDADCGSSSDPKNNWTVNLPPIPKPPVVPVQPPKFGSPVLKVLHISDIHYDPEYLEGANAECGEPLCCRASDSSASNPSAAAGLWGDYRKCDTPLRTLESLFLHINSSHKLDFILWTGDDPPHNVWNQSQDGQLVILKKVTDLIKTSFPNVPVFPALGNHEGIPVNSFPPSSTSTSMDWLYDFISETWTYWLPKNTSTTIKKGGFYSVPVFPGFRIISLNMNFCNNLNWWLLLNVTDPLGELQWLIQELQGAELKGEKVHIIGHIPPGSSDCLKAWSWNYYRIVNRYESTISSQFFGHTHGDSFQLFYDLQETPRRPVSVAYVGPSITPFVAFNPAYRVYTLDGNYADSTWAVLDHETYFLNLTNANRSGKPNWSLVYRAKEAYNMTSLQPEEWDNLVKSLAANSTAFQQFFSFYHRGSDAFPACDAKCQQKSICNLQIGRSGDPSLCLF